MAQWYNGRWVCGSIHTFDGSICQRTPVKVPIIVLYMGRIEDVQNLELKQGLKGLND